MSEKMTTSEPTTENIAKALRVCFEKTCACSECPFEHEYCGDIEQLAADRLESQEAQIKQLTEALAYANEWHKESVENATNELRELSGIVGELERMTARAESAERERDAAFDMIQDMRNCDECKHLARTWKEEPCNCCCREYSMFELCGLPQDGEGK